MKNEVNKEYTRNLGNDTKLEEPPLYQVVLHNDDFTPKEFVIKVLETLFYMDRRKATDVMMEAQKIGRSICGVFTKDFAEAKISQIEEYAKENEHPLLFSKEVA